MAVRTDLYHRATEPDDAIRLLDSLKRRLEHQRRFGDRHPQADTNLMTRVEGDIEEWLIDHGYWRSTE
ncbi:hypothetical protein [Azospirillum argentinense]|uniref:hypothetical protein n=1 Tax=Azospirillum argentinense TaxID=2970906 RepID=UPI0032E04810